MQDISDELEKYDEHWQGIEPTDAPEFGNLPDGKYQVQIDQARVEHARQSGRLQFTLIFNVIAGEPDLVGRSCGKFTGLDTEVGREIAKNDLHRLGMDLDKLSGLPLVTEMLVGLTCEIALVTKAGNDGNEYQNIYINKKIDVEVPPPDGAPW